MDSIEQLGKLRDKGQRDMEAAMKTGQMDEVIRLARIMKEIDDALQSSRSAADRISEQLSSRPSPSNPALTPNFDASLLTNRKARGKFARDTYLHNLSSIGINLRREKGRVFETTSGKRVGITYASEIQSDKWWMGLPNETFDVVILLCETSSGQVLDFVLPPAFVKSVWAQFTVSGGHREWHIQRSGPNYELEPRKKLGQINRYLSMLDPLR